MVKTHPTVMVLLVFGIFVVIYFVFRLLRQPAKEIAEEMQQEKEIRHD
jgi:preprotein translocase subunit YajC